MKLIEFFLQCYKIKGFRFLLVVVFFVSSVCIDSSEAYSQNYFNTYNRYNTKLYFHYDTSQISNIGIGHSQKVLSIFRNADIDHDGKISYSELKSFQDWLVHTYKYKENETALTPDEFIDQGGGDCEDFAIMTCCMLNFHGIIAYVASYGKVTINKHALCLVKTKEPVPNDFIYYTMEHWGIPDGIYTPIDYNKIGGLSAIDRRWKIARLSTPKSLYGQPI